MLLWYAPGVNVAKARSRVRITLAPAFRMARSPAHLSKHHGGSPSSYFTRFELSGLGTGQEEEREAYRKKIEAWGITPEVGRSFSSALLWLWASLVVLLPFCCCCHIIFFVVMCGRRHSGNRSRSRNFKCYVSIPYHHWLPHCEGL